MSFKVSVIVPVYKTESFLNKCLDSLLNQTLNDIEIILVDNGSSEVSKNIISNYINKKNVKLISFDQNQGYGKAMNAGLAAANADYIGILESDDYVRLDMYEILYSIAVQNDADIAKSAFVSYNDNFLFPGYRNISVPVKKPFTINEDSSLFAVHPSIWSCIYKRDFLIANNIKFLEQKGTGWVDNPFQIETLLKAKKIIYTDVPLYYYHIDFVSSSSSLNEGLNIPLNISKIVVDILHSNNVENRAVWENIQFREFSYIDIMISRAKLSQIFLCAGYIKDFLNLIDSKYVLDTNMTFYNKLIHSNLVLLILKLKFRKFLKYLFSLKISKEYKEIRLFGHRYILTGRSV